MFEYINESQNNYKIIACITLFDNSNFGNRLQNYAVQTYFTNLGFSVKTIPYKEQEKGVLTLKGFIHRIAHSVLYFTKFEKRRRYRQQRYKARKAYIGEFTREHIKTAKPVSFKKLPKNYSDEFDYFVTGSDQVWHCWWGLRCELEYFFLTFAEPRKRLTVAPSFGFEKFPEKFIQTYKKGLEGFEYLSAREARGAELIKELTGQEATVLLDPTMLIDTSDWFKILKRPSQFVDNNKYIFVYALGGFKGVMRESVEKVADDLHLQIIDIMDFNSDYYIHTRPDEFLYWINNAQLVITDSFHATVFSILFGKPFVVFDRFDVAGMGSRLDTLFLKFRITGRKYEELRAEFISGKEGYNKLFEVDYVNVTSILEDERRRAADFYKKCFHSVD